MYTMPMSWYTFYKGGLYKATLWGVEDDYSTVNFKFTKVVGFGPKQFYDSLYI